MERFAPISEIYKPPHLESVQQQPCDGDPSVLYTRVFEKLRMKIQHLRNARPRLRPTVLPTRSQTDQRVLKNTNTAR